MMEERPRLPELNWFDWTCFTLVVIGAINWGLVGFFNFNLVEAIFGGPAAVFPRIIFALVGLAGLYCIYALMKVSRLAKAGRQPAEERMRRAA